MSTTASTTAAHARALELWGQGRHEDALEAMRGAVLAGLDAEALNDFGVIAAATLGEDAGRAVFDALLALSPGDPDARSNRDALGEAAGPAAGWRRSSTLGGTDADMPERAFPGMPAAAVMREHALRYAFALDLVAGLRVLDLGCGTGYGSEMLSWTAASVRGFDLWTPAAHELPRWGGGAQLAYGHDLCRDELPSADAAVMYEVLEHLADGPAALRRVWRAVDLLVVSFPNPVFHGSHHNPYHVNDWSLERVEGEVADAAAVRFDELELSHWRQDYRDGSAGMLLPGRDPDASYWVLVARGVA